VSNARKSPEQAFRRYFLWLTGLFLGVMFVMSVLNTWVNPLWVTPMPWSSKAFDDYKPLHKSPRTGKAGLIANGTWDAVLLGSSRVDIAFDPLLPQWQGKRVANIALRGGTLNEHLALLTYATEHQKLDLAIIGADLADVTNPVTIPPGSGFEESPLGAGEPFERNLRYISGISTFEQTLKSLNYRRTGKLAAYTPQGQWLRSLDKRPLRVVLQYESFRWADRFTRQRKQSIEVSQKKVEALHAIIALCREKKIRLILCIPPNHAAYLSVFRLKNDPDPGFRADRETFSRVIAEEAAAHPEAPAVDLWDFNDFHPLNCEAIPPVDNPRAPVTYWADGTHALPTLGTIMLSRMMGWPVEDPKGADYGHKLDLSSLDGRLNALSEGYERYKIEHPDDFKWVQEHMDKFTRTGNSDAAE
jgi:hypothetical protein